MRTKGTVKWGGPLLFGLGRIDTEDRDDQSDARTPTRPGCFPCTDLECHSHAPLRGGRSY
jgi:hypothetical protein